MTTDVHKRYEITINSNFIANKYLIIEKTSESCSLNVLSAFIIKNVIDKIPNGNVKLGKKTYNRNLLNKTKSEKLEAKIFQLTAFNKDNAVKFSLHRSLNLSIRMVYINEFRGIPKSDIPSLLKSQGVIELRKLRQHNSTRKTTSRIRNNYNQKICQLTTAIEKLTSLLSHHQMVQK